MCADPLAARLALLRQMQERERAVWASNLEERAPAEPPRAVRMYAGMSANDLENCGWSYGEHADRWVPGPHAVWRGRENEDHRP